ncbi:MAG: monovalent cation/H(+) antiporter subunit G [Pseudomonadota bacterium]
MEQFLAAASWVCICVGSFFVVTGAIGLLRLPDVYARIHAVSLIEGAGAGFILLGLGLQAGFTLIAVKLLFIFLVILFTVPVATHAVAQAALVAGIEPQLDEDRRTPAKSDDV